MMIGLPSVLALGLLMSGPGDVMADKTQPKINVEPKPKAQDDHDGTLMFGLQLGGMPRFGLGGEWTREKPFWVRAQLTEFVWVKVTCHRPPAEWDLRD